MKKMPLLSLVMGCVLLSIAGPAICTARTLDADASPTTSPHCTDPEYRRLDFRVGDWHQTWITNRWPTAHDRGPIPRRPPDAAGQQSNAHGEQTIVRGVWLPEASGVREIAHTSGDGGTTWRPLFGVFFRQHEIGAVMRATSESDPAAATTLRRLNQEYVDAFMNADVGWYRENLADDFVCIESDGSVLGRDEFLRDAARGPDVATCCASPPTRTIGSSSSPTTWSCGLCSTGRREEKHLSRSQARRRGEGVVISRHWKGISRRDQADAYIRHLKVETFPALRAIPGFVRASILKREVAKGMEFQIITVWDSLDAIRAFAGQDAELAVVPAVAREMMVEFEARASHYEVVHATS